MPIVHSELVTSLDGKDSTKRNSTHARKYMLRGSDNIDDMRDYILDNGLRPLIEDGLVYESADRAQLAPEIWLWTINYVETRRADEGNDKIDVGEFRISFDTTGGTLQAFWTPDPDNRVHRYPPTATDYRGAIQVRDLKPEGCSQVIPALKFDVHYRHERSATPLEFLEYGRDLAAITGRTNLLSFYGFDPGEVLYLGSSGQNGVDSDPVLDHHFIASQNIQLLFDTFTVDKDGHDFLWIAYEPIPDGMTNVGKPKIIGVYVHQIYEPVDFANIGVGDGS